MTSPPSPYRGIEPFRYMDAAVFFGREIFIEDLVAHILAFRLVILFGESGSGKSSLINAGLILRLAEEGSVLERLRIGASAEAPIAVERTVVGENASTGFLPSTFETPGAGEGEPTISLSLTEARRALDRRGAGPRVVLVFDQFEELFTRFPVRVDPGAAGVTQAEILEWIVSLLKDDSLRVKIVISIREDYLAKLEDLASAYPTVFHHRLRLQNLDRSAARMAILGPFGAGDGEAVNNYRSRLSGDLADAVITDLEASGADPLIHPTELQIVCSRLWDQFAATLPAIDVAQYKLLDGVAGILERFLDSQLNAVPADGRDRALRVLGSLITEADTRDVVSEGRLRALTDMEQSTLRSTLTHLEASRLVRRNEQRSIAFWEITSEYLIAPITKAAAEAAQREKAAAARKRAQQERRLASAKEAEAARYRNVAGMAGALAVVAVLLLGAAVYYYQKTSETRREAERLAATLSELQATVVRKDAELEMARARTEQLQRALSADPGRVVPSGAFPSVNVVVGFSSIILVFGIAVSAVTKGMTALLNLRGRYLRDGLVDLLRALDPGFLPEVARRIASGIQHHPMVRDPLGRAGAHLTRAQLVRVMLELAAGTGTERLDGDSERALQSMLADRGIADIDAALRTLLDSELDRSAARKSLPYEFTARIQFWFERMVQRAGVRFVRATTVIAFVSSVAIAALFRLDAFSLINGFYIDPAVRDSLALQAQRAGSVPDWLPMAPVAARYLPFSPSQAAGVFISAAFLSVAAFVWYNAATLLLTLSTAPRRTVSRRR